MKNEKNLKHINVLRNILKGKHLKSAKFHKEYDELSFGLRNGEICLIGHRQDKDGYDPDYLKNLITLQELLK